MRKVKVSIIGCGTISGIYLSNLTRLFPQVEFTACQRPTANFDQSAG